MTVPGARDSPAAPGPPGREYARFAELIHDAVLSTLLDASRGEETADAELPCAAVLCRQAQAPLDQFDEIQAAEATRMAVDGERIRQLDRVARPILERIAKGMVLSAAEREGCRLLEAELRDGLRAPQLMTAELSVAARGARGAGDPARRRRFRGRAAVGPLARDRFRGK
jgi:hypothetical protein